MPPTNRERGGLADAAALSYDGHAVVVVFRARESASYEQSVALSYNGHDVVVVFRVRESASYEQREGGAGRRRRPLVRWARRSSSIL